MIPETDLLERCRKDDRKAHHELYLLCFPLLFAVSRRYFVNREDIMSALNIIFVRIVKNIGSYIRKSNAVPFELWIRRIAINHIVDEFRRNKNYRDQIDLREPAEAESVHVYHPSVNDENMEEILEAVSRLPQMNRTVFNLYVIDGYRHEEIAAMLKISESTSKVHLHKARKRLKDMLEKEWKKKPMDKIAYYE